ncbi:hypothetical protein T11_7683 [Trichinella zimbabwensis]|uniref:Uncharacterized protein n=1 Tax=Trichinella zimbabwensis TaxID=268475 RepID=A0A0V1GP70_9BILA|nr:hypothetical protein T11_7683 [Trichinella zimbabwensis]
MLRLRGPKCHERNYGFTRSRAWWTVYLFILKGGKVNMFDNLTSTVKTRADESYFLFQHPPSDGLLVHYRDPAGFTRINDRTDLVVMSPEVARVEREFPTPLSCISGVPSSLPFAIALCWFLLAHAVSSSSRHSQHSLPQVLHVSTSVTTRAPNTNADVSSPLQYIEGFRRRGHRGGSLGLLRGGFDPLPQRINGDRRAFGSMTERHAAQRDDQTTR